MSTCEQGEVSEVNGRRRVDDHFDCEWLSSALADETGYVMLRAIEVTCAKWQLLATNAAV